METITRSPIINEQDRLTGDVFQPKAFNSAMDLINYKIRSFKHHDSVTEKVSNKEFVQETSKQEFNELFNNKIEALQAKQYRSFRQYFKSSQNWIGYITELHNEYFVAKLADVNDNSTYEMADFYFDEVSKEDRCLVRLGSIFYWSVGYAVRTGQVAKESFIRFQRLPAWTDDEFEAAFDSTDNLRKTLKWED